MKQGWPKPPLFFLDDKMMAEEKVILQRARQDERKFPPGSALYDVYFRKSLAGFICVLSDGSACWMSRDGEFEREASLDDALCRLVEHNLKGRI